MKAQHDKKVRVLGTMVHVDEPSHQTVYDMGGVCIVIDQQSADDIVITCSGPLDCCMDWVEERIINLIEA